MNKHHPLKSSICVLALAVALPAACMAASPVPNKRDQAIKLYNAKNYREAVLLFDQHLTVYPQDVYALYYDALACQALGNMGKAKIFYRQVATLAPNHQLGGYAKSILRQIDPNFATPAASGRAPEASSPADQTQYTIDRSIPSEWTVPCTVDKDNIWVDVELNGHRIKMAFDTGAPSVTIGKNQMAEIGLEAPRGKADGTTGGSSSNEKTPYWMVPTRVKVGGVEKLVQMEVLENNQVEPLLGQSYAGLFECTVDTSAKSIHFRQRGVSKGTNRSAYEVPYVYQESGNRIFVDVEINGKIGRCIFDTGNTSAGISFNDAAQAKKYGITIPHDAKSIETTGVTGSGSSKQFHILRARLGPIDKANLIVNVKELLDDDEPPLLGAPFWEGFEYTINRQKKVIEFVRR